MDSTSARSREGPPEFLRLAGHPWRWRLLSELAFSDRRVRELTALLEQPQSLVSYHLGRLRAARLVSVRLSSADARNAYYSIDLVRCGQLLARAGEALHPGLRQIPPSSGERGWSPRSDRCRVLFLCTGNSARSQIAETLMEHQSGRAVEALSAGSHPKPLHPNAARVLEERGGDLGSRRSKHLSEFASVRFDYVISLCDRVREVCPEFPGAPQTIHWSIPDPAREGDSDEETYPAFQRTVRELETRIRFLLAVIENAPPSPGVT